MLKGIIIMSMLRNYRLTSSLWHLYMESCDGSLRDEKDNGKDDDTFIDFTPMSQPFGDRPTFPPNARPIICYIHLITQISDTSVHMFSVV